MGMIGRKTGFLLALFFATAAMMALQKPLFLWWYAEQAASAGWREWLAVIRHGWLLDLTVAGYITAIPWLLTLLTLFVPIPQRVARRILTGWFAVVSVLTAVILAVDLGLYAHWGFRIDASVLIYLADPKEAMASVDLATALRQTAVALLWAGAMLAIYRLLLRLFDGQRPVLRWLPLTLPLMLLAGGLDFLAIRGGLGASVANVSKVCFSANPFLNHAATNPLFSFLSTLGENEDYAARYPFFAEEERAARFEALRGNAPHDAADATGADTVRVICAERPNVVVVILESFARTLMDAEVEGRAVMPRLRALQREGVWFENFFANSFRTDRGEVAILSGFPAQTDVSIMKLPGKSRNLPSIARSLGRAGYETSFCYGGDLNFTDQAAYLYATGWQELVWQKDLSFDRAPADWGYDDEVMCDWFADRVIARAAADRDPFLAGLLTLSSHPPFDVPWSAFDEPILNATSFADEQVGRMIDKLRASPAWDNLLVVLVADHGTPWPATLRYNEPLRHRIPMLWLGGALCGPRTVETYASQIDLAATLLGRMGVPHDDFDYSKDIFAPAPPPKFAYYAFDDGFGVVDATGSAVYDCTAGRALPDADPHLLDIGRTLLQTTFRDIAER